jgi:UDP-N-acetylglucosamine acyltransferase
MSVNIHQSAIVDKTASLGNNVTVGPNTVIDSNAVIGDDCALDANVVVGKNVKIGSGNMFYSNCVIGRPPQLLGMDPNKPTGQLEIGDRNTIREMVTIHPSMYSGQKTTVGNDNLFMIGVHLGHDVIVQDNVVISNNTQISGHCKIEQGVWLSGGVLVHQFVTFGKWCYAAGFAGVNQDIPPFLIVSGHYPPQVRAVNKRGLKRAGLQPQQQNNITEAFKKLYKADNGVFIDRVKNLAKSNGLDPNVRYMVEFILKSNEHRFGRYLEKFRH